jgi:hypothetical protein
MAIKVWSVMTWADIILICLLIMLNLGSVFFMTGMGRSKKVIIQVDQKVVGIYDLNSPQKTVTVQGPLGPSEIHIQEGKVEMLSSPCLNQTCCKSGWIDRQGQIICCVPNRIFIRIAGDENDFQLDGIAR